MLVVKHRLSHFSSGGKKRRKEAGSKWIDEGCQRVREGKLTM